MIENLKAPMRGFFYERFSERQKNCENRPFRAVFYEI